MISPVIPPKISSVIFSGIPAGIHSVISPVIFRDFFRDSTKNLPPELMRVGDWKKNRETVRNRLIDAPNKP